MRAREIGIYCSLCLGTTLGIVALLFEHATLTLEAATRAQTPQPMTSFDPVGLGTPYGEVSMIDLVGDYLEHPPVATVAGEPGEPKLDPQVLSAMSRALRFASASAAAPFSIGRKAT